MARVYLKGLPELKRKLERLRLQTAEMVRPAMEKAATDLVDMMKRQVPVAHGDLRDSIDWTWGEAPKGSVKIAAAGSGPLKVTVFAGNEKAYYARFVEFGTKPHVQGGEFAGTQSPGTRAQPFFFTSFRAMRREIKTMLRKAIRDAVKTIATS